MWGRKERALTCPTLFECTISEIYGLYMYMYTEYINSFFEKKYTYEPKQIVQGKQQWEKFVTEKSISEACKQYCSTFPSRSLFSFTFTNGIFKNN